MSKIAIQLECRDKSDTQSDKRERICVLTDGDGGIIGVAGPVMCSPPLYGDPERALARVLEEALAGELEEALAKIGYREGEYVVGAVIPVSRETMEMYVRGWGRDSREEILRVARGERSHRDVSLSVEATEACFDKAGDRELTAALWSLWRAGVRVTNSLCEGYICDGGEICQIGPFILCSDPKGYMTFKEFPSTAAAADHIAEIVPKCRPRVETGPRFGYLGEDDGPVLSDQP